MIVTFNFMHSPKAKNLVSGKPIKL